MRQEPDNLLGLGSFEPVRDVYGNCVLTYRHDARQQREGIVDYEKIEHDLCHLDLEIAVSLADLLHKQGYRVLRHILASRLMISANGEIFRRHLPNQSCYTGPDRSNPDPSRMVRICF
jgi:hypothetical protein